MRKVYVSTKAGDSFVLEHDGTESDLFKKVGEYVLTIKEIVPNTVAITDEYGNICQFNIMQRGTWTDDKNVVHPSIHITNGFNDIPLKKSVYDKVLLTCVHPLSNNYKAYELSQAPDGGIIARYESIDLFLQGRARTVKEPYPSWQYWLLYHEKLSKGYVDQSYLIKKAERPRSAKNTPVPVGVNAELYRVLMQYANKVVEETLACTVVTKEMVKKAKSLFKELEKRKTVNGFNTQLQKLIAISPRKRDWKSGDKVIDFMARSKEDFEYILDREENLIMAMDAVSANTDSPKNAESFKTFGIDVFEATTEQKDEVMQALSPSLRSRVTAVYRVKPLAQEKKFDEYVKKHNIKTIKKLWHGSRNENWASIIRTSLNLGHGCANGRMFGDGEYFAVSSEKSYNYTSCRGTTWARGNSSVGFMGLFATAYGNPYLIKSYGNRSIDQKTINQMGYDCVHATKENTGLRADEIIFYDESAMCLNYLVQFAA